MSRAGTQISLFSGPVGAGLKGLFGCLGQGKGCWSFEGRLCWIVEVQCVVGRLGQVGSRCFRRTFCWKG